jgi:uncharacterized protein
MFSSTLYYHLKPLIPRWLQIKLRRRVVMAKYPLYKDIWPIDEAAGMQPEGWQGWPDGKKFALVITHDVETARGHEKAYKLARLDRELGFQSCFNFVPEGYRVSEILRRDLVKHGFEVGVHGLTHSGQLYVSKEKFYKKIHKIKHYLKEWESVGFRTPSMYHKLDWYHDLDIEYDSSTFDTDPFEPQSDGAGTIFPFWVDGGSGNGGYVELPYTMPQDFTLFILMGEKNTGIWKAKLDWIARNGGMALLLAHPDYMHFEGKRRHSDEYPVDYYKEFLEFIKAKYEGQYWQALPRDVARFWANNFRSETKKVSSQLGVDVASVPSADTVISESARKRIWIDLDNTPHVPFFYPIIAELKKRKYEVLLTARDCSQTCGLADLFSMKYRRIGRHYGKSRILKVAGTVLRALQLSRVLNGQKPQLAVSHGSRAQMLSALMQRVPALVIMDYEYVEGFIRPTWIMMPEIIADGAVKCDAAHLLKYPGIKEDVYVPTFKPDPSIRSELGIGENDLLVTIRPPATEAHYHNPESEVLFSKAINLLGPMERVRMVILPRNDTQKEFINTTWREWCANRKIIIPEHVVDGLNLLWYSDLAISGGGTMNREAAALGVPVYSIFRGKIGDVDRYLTRTGRLVLLETVKDIETRLVVQKRSVPRDLGSVNRLALKAVVDGIVGALESSNR